MPYEYRATVVKVVDGDTIDADVDLGFRVRQTMRLRLKGINTPEMHDKDEAVRARALMAKTWLATRLAPLKPNDLVIKTFLDTSDKYGRILAELWLPGQATCLNQQILDAGLAVSFMGDV
jgi:micrococcal nuclease